MEGCFVYKTSRWGIAVGYTYAHDKFQGAELSEDTFLKYGHENMVIRDNYVKAAGGDGITAMYALRPLVEHNTADSVACEINDRIYCRPENRAGKVAAGICSTNPFWASNVKTPVNVKVPVRPLSVCAEPSETRAAEMLGA